MTGQSAALDHARQVADAVLYEGYLLYPYHHLAQKNKVRFQFGVLMPPAYAELDESEPSANQTECVLEAADDVQVRVVLRFLQLQRRTVQELTPDTGEARDVPVLRVDDAEYRPWDEASEREQVLEIGVRRLLDDGAELELQIAPGQSAEKVLDAAGRSAGRITRDWSGLVVAIGLSAERVGGPFGALRLQLRVANRTVPRQPLSSRDDGLRHALIAVHSLISVPAGSFLSMTDPPEWAAAEVSACVNVGTWPVLAGPEGCNDLMLSSPVILYDHAEVAPESAGDLFDATEIDEILTLRTLALTDAEKQAARVTDVRAAELMDRLETMPPELFDRMHGAIRYLRSAPAAVPPEDQPLAGEPFAIRPDTPWWDPGADRSVSPETDHVLIGGVRVARGSMVKMVPGSRRADAQDLFLTGRTARVEAVLRDVDGNVHVAVTPDDDPAADLQRSHGRFLYFGTDEIEPVQTAQHVNNQPEEERA